MGVPLRSWKCTLGHAKASDQRMSGRLLILLIDGIWLVLLAGNVCKYDYNMVLNTCMRNSGNRRPKELPRRLLRSKSTNSNTLHIRRAHTCLFAFRRFNGQQSLMRSIRIIESKNQIPDAIKVTNMYQASAKLGPGLHIPTKSPMGRVQVRGGELDEHWKREIHVFRPPCGPVP